ncbi:MAG: Ribosomal small subunit methyltransferase [Candidatus Saccharibacteria bacterium]|nr:Ribosomal small subunit methyltransferase [Candidatus Saccharibacteria bacterium]MDB5180997.1 Ribosomal small subunit methyltransferase [Candidatus Saccharibacteria bacterium]
MVGPKKSLGQHWLKDRDILAKIADDANISADDTVLEIGPGLGTLTSELLRRSKKVVAVELDAELAAKLPGQFPGTSLEVVNQDILSFDLTRLPEQYVVVANVPYYITSKIIQLLTTAVNKPRVIVLLIQKEVAVRVAAKPGNMSILAVSAQIYAQVELSDVVPAKFFTPPPKVDSQVVVLKTRPKALVATEDEKLFFRVVKAGFSAKRKKLRSSISSGLHLTKPEAEKLLIEAGIDPDDRAEQLSLENWLRLTATVARTE